MRNLTPIILGLLVVGFNLPTSHAQTEVSFAVNECVYGWAAKYYRDVSSVTVRIRLIPQTGVTTPLATLQTRWRSGIITKWSDKFGCMGAMPNLTFDVQWVAAGEHHAVTVRPGSGRSNMTTWYEGDDGDTAAHEFGHMLGMRDEYVDPQCPGRSPINTGTVMHVVGGPIVQRYVDAVCRGVPSEPLDLVTEKTAQSVRASAREEKMTADDLERPTRIELAVSGGPPGKRLQYRVTINEPTTSLYYKYLDETKGRESIEGVGEITAAAIREIKMATKAGPINADEVIADGFVPGSLVATLTIEVGDKKRVVRYPLDDANADAWGQPNAKALSFFKNDSVASGIVSLHRLMTGQAERVGALERRKP
jgi:hypothetical protein